MKVIVVKPMKKPVVKDIGNTLKDMQAVVDGYIEVVYPFEDKVAIVCDEEAKLTGKLPNRVLRDSNYRVYDILCGTFFICGIGEDDFTDIPEELVAKYMDRFECTEEFSRIGKCVFMSAYKEGKCVRFMDEIFPGNNSHLKSKPPKRAARKNCKGGA